LKELILSQIDTSLFDILSFHPRVYGATDVLRRILG